MTIRNGIEVSAPPLVGKTSHGRTAGAAFCEQLKSPTFDYSAIAFGNLIRTNGPETMLSRDFVPQTRCFRPGFRVVVVASGHMHLPCSH